MKLDGIVGAARLIRDQRYAGATAVFAAGSLVRGEGTAYSDLDLVVVYPNVACAYRESFRFQGYPVEAFVHDPETLNYFFLEVDRPSGVPSLPQMVAEGVEIPEPTETSRSLKALAASVLALGPPPLSEQDLKGLRYGITDLLDDIRDPRSNEELAGTGSQLFEGLANYYLRTHGLWSAKGKSIPRALQRADAALSVRYFRSFDDLFARGDARSVIALAEELLAADGGLLFEGYRRDAPAAWRKPRTI
jgi:predicted nucleotidyltransferase